MAITLAGSAEALLTLPLRDEVSRARRLCLVATAAAFADPSGHVASLRQQLERPDAVAVMATDRSGCESPNTVAQLAEADLVIALDGSALHARSMWRGSALSTALSARPLIALGTVGSVLGATMIDPRGGAPTTGLGFFDDVVISAEAPADQLRRTRSLLGSGQRLAVLGSRSVITYDGTWRVLVPEGLRVTRGDEDVAL
jgi:hypothetical protein